MSDMKTIRILSIAAVTLATVCLTATLFAATSYKNTSKSTSKGFAVVELFTSEGCSSCPPADELVGRIEKESNDKPVYILAFHVDYWNRLGWKDIFSNADYSKRQNQYARWLHLSSVYTPQVVVNGTKEFVGSEEGTLRNAIKSSLEKPAKNGLSLDALTIKNKEASLKYIVKGKNINTTLLIALVEKTATSKVLRGENAGHTLSHAQIVSKLQKIELNGQMSGSVTIPLPADFNTQNWEVIAFIQNNDTGEINAADKAGFSSTLTTAANNP